MSYGVIQYTHCTIRLCDHLMKDIWISLQVLPPLSIHSSFSYLSMDIPALYLLRYSQLFSIRLGTAPLYPDVKQSRVMDYRDTKMICELMYFSFSG